MTVTEAVAIGQTDADPTARFNALMSEASRVAADIESVAALNPDFVAKVAAAIDAARESRALANRQHAAIAESLVDAFPDWDDRREVTNWFVYLAMIHGYGRAHRHLSAYVEAGGDANVAPRLPPPAPALPFAPMPGFRFGPFRSPARRRALRAVAALGNPYGAGRVFKAALETVTRTSDLLDGTTGMDPDSLRLVRRALESDAIALAIEGADEALIDLDIGAYDEPCHGAAVAVSLAPERQAEIDDLIRRKLVREGSVRYWAPTLEKLGLDPSDYET